MTDPAVQRSQRFIKAARAERDRLERKRSRTSQKRDALQRKVDALDQELEAIEYEISSLEAFDLEEGGRGLVAVADHPNENGSKQLSGADIRAVAVPLLLREERSAPIHYRAWLELLLAQGYEVAGKRPDAVFLNQVTRSPLTRGTTKAGYYVVDMAVLDQLRERLESQQTELAERMVSAPGEPAEFQAHREGNRSLKTAISRTERELDEVLRAIDAAGLESVERPEVRAA